MCHCILLYLHTYNAEHQPYAESSKLFKSPQVANPQILDHIPLSQICKFLNYACPHVANPQIFMINQQINKFLQNTAQFCLKRSLKVGFLKLISIL